MGRAGRLAWGAVAAAVVLYGAAQAGMRSPWFRVAVERRLSEVAGMEVHVGSIRPTESLNLRIGDISALEERAGLEVRVLRVKWSLFAPRGFSRIRRLSVEDPVVTVAPDGDGVLLPAFAGEGVLELVRRLEGGAAAAAAGETGMADATPVAPDAEARAGGDAARKDREIAVVRLLRGEFLLRDAEGRERALARDVEIERTLSLDAEGRRTERWDVQAAFLSAGGVQLTGVDWLGERTEGGAWNVLRFASDGWSEWSGNAAGDVGEAAEEYRALLDSI